MRSSHAAAAVSSAFDDPNLIAYGGLEPVVRLAERCGLPKLVGEHVRLPASKDGTGAFPAAKLMSLVGGMAAGADPIIANRKALLRFLVNHPPASSRGDADSAHQEGGFWQYLYHQGLPDVHNACQPGVSRKRRAHSMDTHCSFTSISSIQLPPRMRDRVGAF
ncbi:hypothetical protein [Streptomyces sp. NPDC093990]|uniref:hypothetical protein n=1 Tax=Streptomyces sp. NPDC093990 TaxID=3155306 RepID=UPI0034330648